MHDNFKSEDIFENVNGLMNCKFVHNRESI